MIDLHGSIYWCVAQASVVALAGIGISMIAARRGAATACSVVCVTVTVVTSITLVAPLPFHQLVVAFAESPQSTSDQVHGPSAIQQTSPQADNKSTVAPTATIQIDLATIAHTIQSTVATVDIPVARSSRIAQALRWSFLAVIALGVVRLAVGIALVLKLKRSSVAINDDRITRTMRELAESLDCKVVPAVRKSERLSSAAVAGWLQSVVLLPKDWSDWDDDELRAVLAHELAHCVRHDSIWRAIASVLVAAHYYNPLVHWLHRRVVLYQELSADQLAAGIVGNNHYLQSLSKLAIQQDDQIGRSGSPDLLPVFSGHLMRRITMLHSKEGHAQSTNQRLARRTSVVAAIALASLGVATIAARGLAEPPTAANESTNQPVERVARARTVEPTSSADNNQALFARQPLSPSIIAPNNTGMVVIRVRELLELPEVQPYAALLQKMLPKWIESELLGTNVGPVDLEAVEWIAGVATMTSRNIGIGPDEKPRGAVMFGGGGFTIKLNRDFNLTSWINQTELDLEHYVVEGHDVYQFVMPALGPHPMWVSMRDSKTLLANHKAIEVSEETVFADIFPSPSKSEHPMTARWSDTWNRTEGGLFSVLYTNAEFYDSPPPSEGKTDLERAAEKLSRNIHIRCHNYAFGFDVTPDSSSLGVRLRLSHAGRGPATKSAQEIRDILKLAKDMFDKEEALSDFDRDWIEMYGFGMEKATITTEELDDGTADVVISSTVPFDEIVNLYATAITEEFASTSEE